MDRFVPFRKFQTIDLNESDRYCIDERKKDILDQKIEKATHLAYRNLLTEIMGIKRGEKFFNYQNNTQEARPQKYKNFCLNNVNQILRNRDSQRNAIINANDWPVSPRTKPLLNITNPLLVLDLPGFIAGPYMLPVAWSKKGIIAAALQGKIFLWDSERRDILANEIRSYSNLETRALKWSPSGDNLAIVPKYSPKFFIYLSEKISKPEFIIICKCEKCHIFSIEWHPSNTKIASGCSRGILSIFNIRVKSSIKNPLFKRSTKAHEKPIYMIRTNPSGSYLVTTSTDLKAIVWQWDLSKIFTIKLFHEIYCSCWHPSSQTLLAIGGGESLGVHLSIWNVRDGRKNAEYLSSYNITLWSLEWNRLTCELVVGIWKRSDQYTNSEGIVLILSSIDIVVDRVNTSACYLMWSPDNSCLGMAGSDELLRIWQFVDPKKKRKLNEKSKTDARIHKNSLLLFQRL